MLSLQVAGGVIFAELCVRSRFKLSEPFSPDLMCVLHSLLQQGNAATATGNVRAKVVANLPFNLTKSMLRRLLPLGDHISELYLMVQVHMCLATPRMYYCSCRRPAKHYCMNLVAVSVQSPARVTDRY